MNSIHLADDTRLNVASLLMEEPGASRDVTFEFETFELDKDLVATGVAGRAKLTLLNGTILAHGTVQGQVTLECARCLREYDQPFATEFAEEFRQTVDVRSGQGSSLLSDEDELDEDEPGFEIDDAHLLNMSEMLRQNILLELPMRPWCGPDCPGPPQIENGPDEPVDSRFAALQELLNDE